MGPVAATRPIGTRQTATMRIMGIAMAMVMAMVLAMDLELVLELELELGPKIALVRFTLTTNFRFSHFRRYSGLGQPSLLGQWTPISQPTRYRTVTRLRLPRIRHRRRRMEPPVDDGSWSRWLSAAGRFLVEFGLSWTRWERRSLVVD